MLYSLKKICGDRLGATDGEIGHVEDFYFDDKHWAVRYLVADTGAWLPGRRVLISPFAFGSLYQAGKLLLVKLTRKQIEDSPSIDTHKPVSRQYEDEYHRYYGWPSYWEGDGIWGVTGIPILPQVANPLPFKASAAHSTGMKRADTHLRSAKAITGYQIHAGEDTVGQVTDFLMDDKNWVIRQLVVNTGNRFTGKKVLLPTSQIARISYEESKLYVKVTKEAVLAAPVYDEGTANMVSAAS